MLEVHRQSSFLSKRMIQPYLPSILTLVDPICICITCSLDSLLLSQYDPFVTQHFVEFLCSRLTNLAGKYLPQRPRGDESLCTRQSRPHRRHQFGPRRRTGFGRGSCLCGRRRRRCCCSLRAGRGQQRIREDHIGTRIIILCAWQRAFHSYRGRGYVHRVRSQRTQPCRQ